MPTQVQWRRANTANTAVITGAIGEITVDTDKNVVVIHDGVTAGGWPVASEVDPSVTGVFTVTGNVAVTEHITVTNTATFSNNASVGGNLAVTQQLMVTNVATFSNNVTITGDLVITGTTTTINTATLSVADNLVVLNSDHTGAPTLDAGLTINRGSLANVELKWNETNDAWEKTDDGTTYYELIDNNAPTVTQLTVVGNTFQFGTTSEAADGYTLLSGGLIMQWGSVSANDTSGGDASFAITFPNNLWSLTCTPEGATYDATYMPQITASNTSQASIRTANGTSTTVYYTAIGN
jgi:hypothetical protein